MPIHRQVAFSLCRYDAYAGRFTATGVPHGSLCIDLGAHRCWKPVPACSERAVLRRPNAAGRSIKIYAADTRAYRQSKAIGGATSSTNDEQFLDKFAPVIEMSDQMSSVQL